MVRYGEYSPLNPTCRTSSKLLLGIGEYDERKRLLEEKRKQEYKQQGCPARNECSQLCNPENYIAPVTSKFSSKFADKSVQVECGTANEQNKLHRTYVDQCVQVTEAPEGGICEDTLKDEYGIPDKCSQKRKYISGLTHLEVPTDEKLSLNIEDSTVKNDIDFSMLSPRERRLIEFCGSGSYNPSFYEKWKSPIRTVAEKDADTAGEHADGQMASEQLRKRMYQDELRKQIEEKRQLEAQQKEKERREEEVILKRVEQQQLKMKLEFEKEQAQRRQKVEKRMHQFESCKSRNEQDNCVLKSSGSNSENNTKYESSLCTKIEKMKLSPQEVTDSANFSIKCDRPFNKEDSNNGNYLSILEMCQTQDTSKNPGDGSKYKQNERTWTERNCAAGDTASDMTHFPDNLDCVKQFSYQKSSRGFSEASVEDSWQASLAKSSFDPKIPSHVKKDTEILPRKRPVPTPRSRLHSDSIRTVINSASEVPADYSQIHSTVVSTEKENLNDSLPIPILEETKFSDYDSSEVPGTDKVKSGALFRTEAKWKIPAVQKNIIQTGDSCSDKYHGRILTQLGAFRKQLQLDQLRMEERVQSVKTESDA